MIKMTVHALLVAALVGCTTMYHGGGSISNSSKKGQPQRIMLENLIILGFGYDGDLLFKARRKLLAQCKKGATGISTISEIKSGIFFTADQRVIIEATCL